MALKKTSANGFVFPRSMNPNGALLADFDIDGVRLKKSHKDWLEDNVIGPAEAKARTAGHWHIVVTGRASKSGSEIHNLWLSTQRLQVVVQYLSAKLPGKPLLFFPRALGESDPFPSSDYEFELDRSVEVVANFISIRQPKYVKPRLPIRIWHPWRPQPNRKVRAFTFQLLKTKIDIITINLLVGPLGIGQGHALVKMYIKIREVGTPDEAFYEFRGDGSAAVIKGAIKSKGVGPPIKPDYYGTKYINGDAHRFSTEVHMNAGDFSGPALIRFNATMKSIVFGPKKGLFGKQGMIKHLSLGTPANPEFPPTYSEASAFGEMSIAESEPVW